ncbi:hypothetical protein TRFO_42945 [Tritrichomonas foetus]|uniref:LisH domain-containing protein n=1 Tax=Tritrichomonas foetus TaxID=1144522 RepID=A0A1J4KTM6_9EUKA|nr:hypothetical protein TRFO_42945 [Tritrichomonas foetus]|eukprot:OHT14611.1 hypothetical protein TRFO_42945 [Tritrichomonas foetus]
MEIPIDAPLEIKHKIAKKIQKNGSLRHVERKIKMGMMIAVQELRENPDAIGNLERKPFKNANPYELKALQSIFNFLSTNNMAYTLSTLLEESAVRRNINDTTDIMELIDHQINHVDHDMLSENSDIDDDERYYDEKPESKYHQSRNSNKMQHYALDDDNDYNSKSSSSSLEMMKTFSNTSKEKLKASQKDLESQGMPTNKKAFERNSFIISIVNL